MRNLKLTLSYDGTDFSGWQVQPGASTVQGMLSSAIARITGENVLPQASGRTDAGVHALAQVATFVTDSTVPTQNFVKALNDLLPGSVRVLEIEEAGRDFHARHSARAKTYRYRIYREAICPPFLARSVWHYPYPLDEEAMTEAATLVVGEHDFTSFAAVDPERGRDDEPASNVRTIFSSSWVRDRSELTYTVRIRVLTSHGPEPGGDVYSGREKDLGSGGNIADSFGENPLGGRSHRPRQRTVSGQRRVLMSQYVQSRLRDSLWVVLLEEQPARAA
jgi:tRNA pseudouridine38-40 synthase